MAVARNGHKMDHPHDWPDFMTLIESVIKPQLLKQTNGLLWAVYAKTQK